MLMTELQQFLETFIPLATLILARSLYTCHILIAFGGLGHQSGSINGRPNCRGLMGIVIKQWKLTEHYVEVVLKVINRARFTDAADARGRDSRVDPSDIVILVTEVGRPMSSFRRGCRVNWGGLK